MLTHGRAARLPDWSTTCPHVNWCVMAFSWLRRRPFHPIAASVSARAKDPTVATAL